MYFLNIWASCLGEYLSLVNMGLALQWLRQFQWHQCSQIAFAADRCVAVTSSHFCSAERQFRFPLEYGGQRTPTAQWTVTGSGAAIIQRGGSGVKIKRITIGRITDMGIKDANNMGAAMAPAAAQTILDYFSDTKRKATKF